MWTSPTFANRVSPWSGMGWSVSPPADPLRRRGDPFCVLRDEGRRADHSCMAVDQNERRASDGLGDTLLRRRADDLRTAEPVRTRFARFLGLRPDARASNRGANGELVSGWWLGQLPEGWHVINEVPVGDAGAKVDHVVIGPSGVFTINTKNLTGKVWVGPKSILYNRRSTDFLPRATAEAGRASRLLAAAVGRAVEEI